jgi:deazaflavin-dependent oxidoreductase (nitroreductase family)
MSTNINDWNRQIIEEFRLRGGKVGGMFEGAPIVLLHTTGAKSGKERVNPLVAFIDGERMYVFASYGGAPTDPDWFHNLVANPQVTVEFGHDTYVATARLVEGAERDDIWNRQVAVRPNFGEYQDKTARVIPVVELVRE